MKTKVLYASPSSEILFLSEEEVLCISPEAGGTEDMNISDYDWS